MDTAPPPPRDHPSGTGDAQQKQQALEATQALGGGIDDDPDEFPALLAEARHRRSVLDVQLLPSAERSEEPNDDIVAAPVDDTHT